MKCLLILGLILGLTACDPAAPQLPASPSSERPKLLLPERGLYTGAYMGFGDREDDVTLEKIEAFEELVGKHQAIVASSSYWGEGTFPEANVRLIARHGSIPLIYWSPWDRPYMEGRGPDKYSLTSIIAGEHDAYIDEWARKAKAFGYPMIVSFGNEMNGSWFPWSGLNYGGNTVVAGSQPPRYQGPETFKSAMRHVVDRVRAQGADNVQWVLHLMDYSMPQDVWNLAAQYYPGPEYVDWLGFSLYGAQFPGDGKYPNFTSLFDWPYTELTLLDATKPIMLCEWGVGEFPKKGSKADWMMEGFRVMTNETKYPRLKAAVYWHERWQNSANTGDVDMDLNAGKYSDLRVNSSVGSLRAYRQGVAGPLLHGEVRLTAPYKE